jgi:hypothetical protein
MEECRTRKFVQPLLAELAEWQQLKTSKTGALQKVNDRISKDIETIKECDQAIDEIFEEITKGV